MLEKRGYVEWRIARRVAFVVMFVLALTSWAGAIDPRDLERTQRMKEDVRQLMDQQKYRQATAVLRRVLEINPQDKTASRYLVVAERLMVEHYCKEAHTAYQESDFRLAIRGWENVLKVNPNDIRAERMIEFTKNLVRDTAVREMYALVEQFLREGDHEGAVNELEKILAIEPNDRRAHELLTSSREAIINARIEAHFQQADAFMDEGKYDLAIEEWQQILDLEENQQEASRLIAAARRLKLNDLYEEALKLRRAGDYVGAREVYYKISAENPTDEDVKTLISRLNDTIKVVPKVQGEGLVQEMLRKALTNHISVDGNPKVAIAAAWYAEQLEPTSEVAFALKSFLERQHLLVFRSMEPPIRDMTIIDQYLFAALNHIYEGRYDLAIEECSIVIALDPDNVLALKRMGSAYFALGRKDKARETWEKALTIAPKDAELKEFIRQVKR